MPLKAVYLTALIAVFLALPCQVAALNSGVMEQAEAALNSKDYGRAIRVLEEASSADPFDEQAKACLGLAYRARGWERAAANNFEAAYDDFRKASLVEPEKQADTYLGLGFGAFMLKKNDDALDYLDEAVYLDPGDGRGHELIGEIYYQRGRLTDAIREWEAALGLTPGNHGIKGRLDKAKKELGVEGSFTKRETYYFNIKYEGEERRELGDEVFRILDDAAGNVGGDLGYYPKEPVTVILYTREQFTDITNAPSWSGGVFDGIIRIPIGGKYVDRTALAAVLHHEYAHAVVHMMADNKVPTWLNEGIAQYEERWVRVPAAGTGESGGVSLSSLGGSFMSIKEPERVKQAYAESLSAVRYFVDRFGMYSLGKLVRLIGEGKTPSDAMQEATGASLGYFEEAWRASGR